LQHLMISNIPSLHEVCVWTTPFPPDTVDVDKTGSPNVNFTTDCSVTEIKNNQENSTINIYPNPTIGVLNIEINNIDKQGLEIEILDITGKFIYQKEYSGITAQFTEQIDLSGYSKGIYFVKIRQDNSVDVGKIVVK
jgi:hypothetical protein